MKPTRKTRALRVAVIDMQPITPAFAGGRQRLLGVWHGLGDGFEAEYVGTYDWPEDAGAVHVLTPTLTENMVPLAREHFSVLKNFNHAAGSQSLIDTIFPQIVPLSTAYLARARRAIRVADVVAFAHPWAYPPLAGDLDGKWVIYDSQNVELLLKMRGLARDALGYDVLRSVARTEAAMLSRANHVLACSTEDKNAFALIYDLPLERISVAPNGVFVTAEAVKRTAPAAAQRRRRCVFIGSDFEPNVEAAMFLVGTVSPQVPEVDFVLLGQVSVSPRIERIANGKLNVQRLGLLDDARKNAALADGDFAVNPIFSGSGTNIKMFDFMAAGLPILTTPKGARGIAREDVAGIRVREPQDFAVAIRDLAGLDGNSLAKLGAANHAFALEHYSWAKISAGVGKLIHHLVDSQRPIAPAASETLPASDSVSASTGGGSVRSKARAPRRLAVMSTYGIRCGIAGYAESFAQALHDNGADIEFLAATTPNETPAEGRFAARVVWEFDNVTWKKQPLDLDKIAEALGRGEPFDHLNIQHHPGFYPAEELVRLCERFGGCGMGVSITLHNSSEFTVDAARELARLGAVLLVHQESEAKRLGGAAHHIPHGSRQLGPRARASKTLPLVIGSFGFIMEHKGIGALIEALPIVRAVYPQARLLANCATYSTIASRDETRRCQELVCSLGLESVVTLNNEFQSAQEIAAGFERMSVAVFPYAYSSEGSSGAANAAVMAGVPTLTSTSPIFLPLRDSVYQFADTSPAGIAFALLDYLGNPDVGSATMRRADLYRHEYSWPRVLERFLALVSVEERTVETAA